MRKIVQNLEYRGYLGLDTRADTTLIQRPYQIEAENVVLRKGVLECKEGNSQWGSLDHSALLGTLYTVKGFDTGTTEYVLLHKGTSVYFGLKASSSYTIIQDLTPSNLVVADAESEMEAMGFDVGVTGQLTFKVLFKQAAACKILEFVSGLGLWIGRNTGLDNSGVSFSATTGAGADSQPGTYRVRVTAQRIIDGVRVNETPSVGKVTSSTKDDLFFQEVVITGAGGSVEVTIADSSPDAQTTHYGVQITRVLDLVGDTEFSQNGNDSTIYYEAVSVPIASLGVAQAIATDVEDLAIIAVNLIGHLPIPGHLISKVTGNIVFFSGVAPNKNRIFNAGASGFYYHSEYYDPFVFHSGGDDDGQLVIGLGRVQDHLVVFKEGRTGIIPNRALDALLVWRDYENGITDRHAFENVSDDEMIVLNHDGVFRIFNGIRYDRERSIADTVYGFSENIRIKSETIDASNLDFIYDDERMHIIYKESGLKRALLFHPRDGYGWTEWTDIGINEPFRMNNGLDFIFENDGKLWEQNPATAVFTEFGDPINWTISFALMTNQITKKDKVLIKLIGVDGDFDSNITGQVQLDLGRETSAQNGSLPEVSDGYSVPWYQLPTDILMSGNYVKLTIKGTGRAVIRGIYWGYINRESGNLGWSQVVFNPSDFVGQQLISLDALTQARDESEMVEADAGTNTRNDAEYIEYTREV